MTQLLDRHFPRYHAYDPAVPVWCVTPEIKGCIHRFFDTSPVSPSGRYCALTQLPFEDRMPQPGDLASVVLVDLKTGHTRSVAETRGWDTQVGAHVQWGADDRCLFYNDLDPDTTQPFAVVTDPATGECRRLDGPVYMVSRDGTRGVCPDLRRMSRTQLGYGVILSDADMPANSVHASPEDGVYVIDVHSGRSRLLVSLEQIIEDARPAIDTTPYGDGVFYAFHTKWNDTATRIMVVLRYVHDGGEKRAHCLATMKADGTDIRTAVPFSEWAAKGGHHPQWHPDNEHVLMNLKCDYETLRFVQARYDGADLRALSERIVGSGHPSIHPNGRLLVTDAYNYEGVAFDDGSVPIRLVDLQEETCEDVVRISTEPVTRGESNALRVDPHPAWDRSFRYITFNGCEAGSRKVYIADLSSKL